MWYLTILARKRFAIKLFSKIPIAQTDKAFDLTDKITELMSKCFKIEVWKYRIADKYIYQVV